ncbi:MULTISPECIES: DUF5133 domain-containing protein [unclassified Streptomyces]|uniref:DUF5133 domain-containing protein n=1 Tax=unclassified Streptomyces TaxID=2593676 RepID=UPI0027E39F30|nr:MULTISPECIES: DUF5133 domain-containing protein [unclassified Streptomyces]
MTRSGRTSGATHPGPTASLGGGRDVHFFQDFQERIHMLMPHPVVLRGLVEEYEALMAREGDGEAGKGRRALRAQDLAYTLCVSTGTREVSQALATARRLLAAARDPEESAIAG